MPSSISRRKFLQTAAGISAASIPAWAQDAGPQIILRPTQRPSHAPTLWLGAVTPTSAVVKTKLPPGTASRLLVLKAGAAPLSFKPQAVRDPQSNVTTFVLAGLEPASLYTLTLEVLGRPASFPPGVLRTFPPANKPASFSFAFSSCARTGSQHRVFTTIVRKEPAFFLHLGDFHYVNISRNDPRLFRAAWDTVLSSSTQGALYRTIPLDYVWDDHDFGPNNCDRRSPSRDAARAVYREYAPHYPLVSDGPIQHAFSIARARFIITDLRSERTPVGEKDGPNKSLMGSGQKEWFKRELLAASRSHALVFWGSSVPWNGQSSSDAWANYQHERREIANFIARHRIRNLCILCGDAHMLAADDGTYSDFGDESESLVRVLHGSALDQAGSFKGGPYSHRSYLPRSEEGCFGWVNVEDDGTHVAVSFTGRNQKDEVKVSLAFTVA